MADKKWLDIQLGLAYFLTRECRAMERPIPG